MRAHPAIILFALALLPFGFLNQTLRAQPASPESEQFEVTSIRPTLAVPGPPSMEVTPKGIRVSNVTLKMLVEFADDTRPEQLSGGDGWTETETFLVTGNGPEGGPSLSSAGQDALTRKRLQTPLGPIHLTLKREENDG